MMFFTYNRNRNPYFKSLSLSFGRRSSYGEFTDYNDEDDWERKRTSFSKMNIGGALDEFRFSFSLLK